MSIRLFLNAKIVDEQKGITFAPWMYEPAHQYPGFFAYYGNDWRNTNLITSERTKSPWGARLNTSRQYKPNPQNFMTFPRNCFWDKDGSCCPLFKDLYNNGDYTLITEGSNSKIITRKNNSLLLIPTKWYEDEKIGLITYRGGDASEKISEVYSHGAEILDKWYIFLYRTNIFLIVRFNDKKTDYVDVRGSRKRTLDHGTVKEDFTVRYNWFGVSDM